MGIHAATITAVAFATILSLTTFGQQSPQPLLESVFSDDYGTDTREDYDITGEVLWSPGTLTLAAGAVITREIDRGPYAQLQLHLVPADQAPVDSPSEMQIRFVLDGATSCFVRVRQHRANENGEIGSLAVVDTSEGDGQLKERVVRQTAWNAVAPARISVEYRHGLVQVTVADRAVLAAHIENGRAAVRSISLQASAGTVGIGQLTAAGTTRELREFTESEKEQLADAAGKNRKLVELFGENKFSEAAVIGEQALAIRRRILGEEHIDVGLSLNNLSMACQGIGDFTRATPLLRQALGIRRSVLGEQHPTYAANLYNLAGVVLSTGEFAEAETLYKQAIAIEKSVLGEQHPNYASSLNNLAQLYNDLGDYSRAEPLLQQAVGIWKLQNGGLHPEYAGSLMNLARLYVSMGKYSAAEPLFMQALQIRKTVLGEHHPSYADAMVGIAMLYRHKGDPARAEPLLSEALEISQSVKGEEDSDCAIILTNLAAVYHAMGQYGRAEPPYLRALEIWRRLHGEQHASFAATLNGLAGLYDSMGDLSRAEDLYQQVLEVMKSERGEQHPAYATCLNNLAGLYVKTEEFERAEKLYNQALQIRKSALGPQHPDYVVSLVSTAMLYHRMGRFESAQQLYQEALKIWKDEYGDGHPHYATMLNNFAELYRHQGNYDRAELLYLQASEIWKAVLGEKHPDYATSLGNLATLYDAMGDHELAKPLHAQAMEIQYDSIQRSSLVQSARQQIRNQAQLRDYLDGALSNALHLQDSVDQSLEALWRWKGAVTRRQRAYREVSSDPQLASLLDELRISSRSLSALTAQAPIPPATSAPQPELLAYQYRRTVWEKRFVTLNLEHEKLEKRLAERSSAFREIRDSLTVAEVRQSLPNATAFVEFLEYRHTISQASREGMKRSERRFVAFVIRPDRQPVAIGLGSAASLTEAITDFRRPLGGSADIAEHRERAALAARLIQRELWKPIEEHLVGIDTVILSPDTVLGTLPFGALPGKSAGRFLIEDYRIATMPIASLLPATSTRERGTAGNGLLIVGDIDYDAERSGATENAGQLALLADATGLRSGRERWESLTGFRDELESVQGWYRRVFGKSAPTLSLTGRAASESEFLRNATHYDTLHVITHGFFSGPEVQSVEQAEGNGSTWESGSGGSDSFLNRWMPGLLSGLVMAGANNPSEDPADPRDGILRASEIESASLRGVDLVVLSACETGLGAVAGGEGLTGLQRAFHIAGARSVIASLWKVDDRATQELMRRFYKNLWQQKMSKIDALREAQLWMLRHPAQLEEMGVTGASTRGLRRRTELIEPSPNSEQPDARTDPFFWSAFQLSGDWR